MNWDSTLQAHVNDSIQRDGLKVGEIIKTNPRLCLTALVLKNYDSSPKGILPDSTINLVLPFPVRYNLDINGQTDHDSLCATKTADGACPCGGDNSSFIRSRKLYTREQTLRPTEVFFNELISKRCNAIAQHQGDYENESLIHNTPSAIIKTICGTATGSQGLLVIDKVAFLKETSMPPSSRGRFVPTILYKILNGDGKVMFISGSSLSATRRKNALDEKLDKAFATADF